MKKIRTMEIVNNINENQNFQIDHHIQFINPVIINQDELIRNDNNEIIGGPIQNNPNMIIQQYFVWYCMQHGDCFLTSRNQEPRAEDSRCGVLNECYYEEIGFLTVVGNRTRFMESVGMNVENFFENQNDGYTLAMLNNMIQTPEARNAAILY